MAPDGRSGYLVPDWLAAHKEALLMSSLFMPVFLAMVVFLLILGDASDVNNTFHELIFNKMPCASS
jgi:hypothetical protein